MRRTKLMASRGVKRIRSRIVIYNKTTEQVNNFNYLANQINCQHNHDIHKQAQQILIP